MRALKNLEPLAGPEQSPLAPQAAQHPESLPACSQVSQYCKSPNWRRPQRGRRAEPAPWRTP
jgi:hypothetical protein